MTERSSQVLKNLLESIFNLNQRLNQSLLEESLVLKQSLSAETLNTIAAQKTHLVTELNQKTTVLTNLIGSSSMSKIGIDIKAYIKGLTISNSVKNELASAWLSIEDSLTSNQSLNEQNGATLELLSRHQRRRLQILSGQNPTTQTYGPDGVTHYGQSSKALASA